MNIRCDAWWDQLIIWGGLLAVGWALGTEEAQGAYFFGLFLAVACEAVHNKKRAEGKGPLTGGEVLVFGGLYFAFLLAMHLRGERDFVVGMLLGNFYIAACGCI